MESEEELWKMRIIALTGGIACGKTTVAGMLKECGAAVVDADEISRSLTAAGGRALGEIRRVFGDGVFAPDGTLDRAKLGAQVFSNEEKRLQLNAILHPMVMDEMKQAVDRCREDGAQIVILDVPLLFEANMQHMGEMVVCVSASQEVQIARMASRNGWDREEALRRIRSQMPMEEKRSLSDVVIDTDKPIETLREEICQLYRRWIKA